MDKRKLKSYVNGLPKAMLHNGNERYVTATENLDDIAVVKIFFKKSASRLSRAYSLGWVHFYSKKEKEYITYDLTGMFKTKWLKKKLMDVPGGYLFNNYHETGEKGVVNKITKEERIIQADKLKKKYETAIAGFKQFNRQVRKVPKQFLEWIEKECMPGFGLYDNRRKLVECTKCGRAFNRAGVGRGDRIICPECGKTIVGLPIGHYRVDTTGYSAFAQKCGFGLVIRYYEWTIRMSSSAGNYKNVIEYRRDFLSQEGDTRSYVYHTYKQSGYTGFMPAECFKPGMGYYCYREPFSGFTTSAEFWFGCSKLLKKSGFQYHILQQVYHTEKYKEFVQSDVTYYFNVFGKYPALETMFKNKQYELIRAALKGYPKIKEKEVIPTKALGLSRSLILKLADNCKPELLEELQYLYKEKQCINDEIIDFLRRQPIRIRDLDMLIKFSLKKIIRYVNGQGPAQRILDYIDYLDCCRSLNIRMTKGILYPQNLMAAHDEAVNKVKVEKNRIKDEQYKELKEKHLKKYREMEIGDLVIRLPNDIGEIIYEGLVQHNCVGNVYIDRILDRRSDILFVRKKDLPDEPFVTLEVHDDRIVQCRYKYNRVCGPEITDVVEDYLSMIKEEERAA